jgi:RNA polymerase sigma-70 factor (ECF subfamily)
LKNKKSSIKHLNDESLMKALSYGNSEALEVLYDRYFDKLTWFAQQFTSNLQIAEDLVQEVFMKIIESPNSYDSNKTFSTWIYTLVANKSKNYLRDTKNRQMLLESQNIPNSTQMHSNIDYQKLENELQKAILEMKDKDKTIYHLRFEQELPIKEIALITQIPEGTVKSSIFYLLKKLSQKLKDF